MNQTAELVKKCQERMKSIRDKNYFTLRFGKTKMYSEKPLKKYKMKQTAVEWLEEQIYSTRELDLQAVINQAKEMEKEQSLTMSDYNLEELAKEFAIQQLADPKEYDTSIYAATIQNTYMVGFQKALELLTF